MTKPDLVLSELRGRLLPAVRAGSALALLLTTPSCGGSANGTPPSSNAGAPNIPATLLMLPAERLGCFGEAHSSGYHGQCCVTQRCYTPTGSEECQAIEGPLVRSLTPPGSGSCGCGDADHPAVAGPYARNASVPASSEGSCCYLIGSIGCEGRPLRVDGQVLLAPVVVRGDWGRVLSC